MDSSPHHFQAGESPLQRGFAAPQLMRDTTVQFSCNPLGYGTSRHLLQNRRQGNQLTRRRITRANPTTFLSGESLQGSLPQLPSLRHNA